MCVRERERQGGSRRGQKAAYRHTRQTHAHASDAACSPRVRPRTASPTANSASAAAPAASALLSPSRAVSAFTRRSHSSGPPLSPASLPSAAAPSTASRADARVRLSVLSSPVSSASIVEAAHPVIVCAAVPSLVRLHAARCAACLTVCAKLRRTKLLLPPLKYKVRCRYFGTFRCGRATLVAIAAIHAWQMKNETNGDCAKTAAFFFVFFFFFFFFLLCFAAH